MRWGLCSVVLVWTLRAAAQELPVPQVGHGTTFERCFAVPAQVWVAPQPQLYVGGSVSPSPTGGAGGHPAAPVGSSGGSGGGGGIGGGNAEGLLVLAVIAIAAAPIIVYAIDEPAEPLVVQRYECPVVAFEGSGGLQTGAAVGTLGIATGRFTFAMGLLGVDAQFELAPGAVSVFATHLLLRPVPKAHLEGGLALGFRSASLWGHFRDGFEVGLPHRYAFFRDGLRTVGLDLRPYLVIGNNGVDAGVEGAFVFPLAEFLHVRAGGRVFSFGSLVMTGLDAGLSFTL